MQAQALRHINPGRRYDPLIPKSVQKDSVIKGRGMAELSDTLKLMQQVIAETLSDTALLAQKLKSQTVADSCRKIWHFVYGHIQYKMDKRGVEQVRRPSRTWADRKSGVDCDCYTVFIGSILSNMGIPYTIRITKYGGKQHFQHVYPVVNSAGKEIILDCVNDRFNYEVPYSEKKDILVKDTINIKPISELSGVDTLAIGLNALEQPRISLHRIYTPLEIFPNSRGCSIPKALSKKAKQGKVLSPFRLHSRAPTGKMNRKYYDLGLLDLFLITTISIAAGAGVVKLFSKRKTKTNTKSKANIS
ncbi:hypothetical protein [Aquimarina celericrescens]|uniref:Transglutaminase-like domain-containing protein n=1 Tax=Aquimarina celericrescens TaxID=1964542 RepID=A0ABW5AU05_9FLAO|nr:hypothetical protein [Aquimarina celericrescens]